MIAMADAMQDVWQRVRAESRFQSECLRKPTQIGREGGGGEGRGGGKEGREALFSICGIGLVCRLAG